MYYFLCQPHAYTQSIYIHTIGATYTHEYTDCVTGQSLLKIFSTDKSETGI